MQGADVFLGVSGPNLLTQDMLRSMAAKPVVFALSNPDPEIRPELAHAARTDLIMASGRSDYPNQVNNVLGFPFIFRGALDVRAHTIHQKMLIAAVHALAALARQPVPKEVLAAYNLTQLPLGMTTSFPSRSIRVCSRQCRRPWRVPRLTWGWHAPLIRRTIRLSRPAVRRFLAPVRRAWARRRRACILFQADMAVLRTMATYRRKPQTINCWPTYGRFSMA